MPHPSPAILMPLVMTRSARGKAVAALPCAACQDDVMDIWFIGRQSMPLISRDTELERVTPTSGFRRSLARVADFVALTKPRVMSLVVFTALVGLTLAPEPLGQRRAVIILLCIAAGAGGAAALNMWYDADIDAVMERTSRRPIPSGRVSRTEGLIFGLTLGTCAV